jgi:hypothetical protein
MAVRLLYQLLQEINAPLLAAYPNGVTHGLAVLQPRDGRTFPMRRTDTEEGAQISPYDGNGLIFYHRLISQGVEPIEGAKGNKSYSMVTYNMRLVGVGARKNITSSTDMNNVDIAKDVMAIMGGKTILTGKEIVTTNGQVITNKLEVLQTEFTGQTEFQKNTLRLIAFSIDYTITQRQICLSQTVPSSTATEFVLISQANYDALGLYGANTYYLIDDTL